MDDSPPRPGTTGGASPYNSKYPPPPPPGGAGQYYPSQQSQRPPAPASRPTQNNPRHDYPPQAPYPTAVHAQPMTAQQQQQQPYGGYPAAGTVYPQANQPHQGYAYPSQQPYTYQQPPQQQSGPSYPPEQNHQVYGAASDAPYGRGSYHQQPDPQQQQQQLQQQGGDVTMARPVRVIQVSEQEVEGFMAAFGLPRPVVVRAIHGAKGDRDGIVRLLEEAVANGEGASASTDAVPPAAAAAPKGPPPAPSGPQTLDKGIPESAVEQIEAITCGTYSRNTIIAGLNLYKGDVRAALDWCYTQPPDVASPKQQQSYQYGDAAAPEEPVNPRPPTAFAGGPGAAAASDDLDAVIAQIAAQEAREAEAKRKTTNDKVAKLRAEFPQHTESAVAQALEFTDNDVDRAAQYLRSTNVLRSGQSYVERRPQIDNITAELREREAAKQGKYKVPSSDSTSNIAHHGYPAAATAAAPAPAPAASSSGHVASFDQFQPSPNATVNSAGGTISSPDFAKHSATLPRAPNNAAADDAPRYGNHAMPLPPAPLPQPSASAGGAATSASASTDSIMSPQGLGSTQRAAATPASSAMTPPAPSKGGPPVPAKGAPPAPSKSPSPPPSEASPTGTAAAAATPPAPSKGGPPVPAKSSPIPPAPSKDGPPAPAKGGPPAPAKGGPPAPAKGGPPMPTPGAGGPPPPAGGAAGGKGAPVLSQAKRRALFWATINTRNIQDGAVWNDVGGEVDDLFDEEERQKLDEAFAPRAAKEATAKEKEAAAAADARPKKIQIIDGTRERNVDITLRYLRVPVQTISRAVQEFDETIINDNALDGLVSILPTTDDLAAVKPYLNRTEEPELASAMSTPVRFFIMVSLFPNFATRVQAWKASREVVNEANEARVRLAKLRDAVECIKNSKQFPTLLKYILSVGNHLNEGTKNEKAKGFRIGDLGKLKIMKTSDGKATLVQVLVGLVTQKNPAIHDVLQELEPLSLPAELRNVTVDELNRVVANAERRFEGFRKYIDQNAQDPAVQNKLARSLPSTQIAIQDALNERDLLRHSIDHLAKYLSESPNGFDVMNVMTTLNEFMMDYARAKAEIDARQERAARQQQLKQQQQQQQ